MINISMFYVAVITIFLSLELCFVTVNTRGTLSYLTNHSKKLRQTALSSK